MKALFLVPSQHGASTRYRVLQFLPALEEAGAEVTVETIERGWFARNRQFKRVGDFDLVFLQKRLVGVYQALLLRRHAPRLVYDLDDAVMYRDSRIGRHESMRRWRRFRAIAGMADLVIAGNSYLAEHVTGAGGEATVIPTVLDPDEYRASAQPTNDRQNVIVGWIGSRSTLKYWLDLKPVFEALVERSERVRFRLICDEFPDLPELPIETRAWAKDTEAAELADFDIGLAPLRRDVWTRGKCGFKILQYFAAGKPVVCTPVGANAEIVEDEVDGLYAVTGAEWIDRVGKLIDDAPLRRRLGEKGRRKVADEYSIQAWAPRWVEALTGLVSE